MLIDNALLFSDSQAITATAASTNIIDTAPLFSGNTGRRVGDGKRMFIWVMVEVAFTDSGSDTTLAVTIETDDNTSMSSPTTIATLTTFAALTAAGTKFFAPIPLANYERYIGLRYTVANGNLTTGTISAGLSLDQDNFYATAPGFTTGVE